MMEHVYQRRVQFADTDAAGVVHFSRVLCYVEEAEHDLLGELGIPLLENGGWPRVSVTCDYAGPLRIGDTADVKIAVIEIGDSSVGWQFSVSSGGKVCAEGKVKTVRIDAEGKPEVLKPEWRETLQGVAGC